MAAPKLTLYTNLGCPWANRAHIALKELGLEYETVISTALTLWGLPPLTRHSRYISTPHARVPRN